MVNIPQEVFVFHILQITYAYTSLEVLLALTDNLSMSYCLQNFSFLWEIILESAAQIDVEIFIQPADIYTGCEPLLLIFMACLFNTRHGLQPVSTDVNHIFMRRWYSYVSTLSFEKIQQKRTRPYICDHFRSTLNLKIMLAF